MQNTNHFDSGGHNKNAPIYIQGTRSLSQSEPETPKLDRKNSADGQRDLSTLLAIRRFGFFCLFIALILTLRTCTQKRELANVLQEYKQVKEAVGKNLYSQNK